jgi:hypothetical protein
VLKETGVEVVDPKNGIVTPRVDAFQAVQSIAAPVPMPVVPALTTMPTISPSYEPSLAPSSAPVPMPVAPVLAPRPQDSLPWLENFDDLPNGSQSDNGITPWSLTRDGKFDVQNGALVLNDGGSEGVFMTGTIDISGAPVNVSLDLFSTGPLETNQDYVRLFAILDNGPEVLLGGKMGVQSAPTAITGSGVTGNSLVLVIRAYVSWNDEFYTMDNLSVASTGPIAPVDPPPTPVPSSNPSSKPSTKPSLGPSAAPMKSLAPSSKPSAKPSLKPGTATCDVPWTGPSYTIDEDGFSKTEIIDTSCLDDITIAMSISHSGGLETSGGGMDTLQIFYQIDNEPEVLWTDIKGDDYSNIASTVASGYQLKIRTVGDLTWNDEFYYVQLWVLPPGSPIPASVTITTNLTSEKETEEVECGAFLIWCRIRRRFGLLGGLFV